MGGLFVGLIVVRILIDVFLVVAVARLASEGLLRSEPIKIVSAKVVASEAIAAEALLPGRFHLSGGREYV